MESTSQKIDYPPCPTESEIKALAGIVKDWALANGLCLLPPERRLKDTNPVLGSITAIHAPVTLFPSPFPRQCFEQAKSVQKAYNELYARVSMDGVFLASIVREMDDPFISHLLAIHDRVQIEGYTQDISLGVFRSDYLVHRDGASPDTELQLKQVEFNTISAAFGGLTTQTCQIHKYLSLSLFSPINTLSTRERFYSLLINNLMVGFLAEAAYHQLQSPIPGGRLNLPANNATEAIAAGMGAAIDAYGVSQLGLGLCVIFLTQVDEKNVFDQRHLEYKLRHYAAEGSGRSNHLTPIYRLHFHDIERHTTLADTPKRQLLLQPPTNPSLTLEVALVYLRSGFSPAHYPDEATWRTRYYLERSAAIKAPSVLTQLAGCKKIQEVLAMPVPAHTTSSHLGRFVGENSAAERALRQTFMRMYPMDTTEAGLEGRRLALDADLCRKYVLKPQREGGGNNVYRAAIPAFLRSTPGPSWSSFILMELITPPPARNIILRNGRIENGGVVCELGIFGTCVWNCSTREILWNQEAGYLLRTKGDKNDEGGVAAGFGCMDSCALV